MSASGDRQPTLDDVYSTGFLKKCLRNDHRRRIDKAFDDLVRCSGIPLAKIPATMPQLRRVLDSIEPAAHGVSKRSIGSMRNLIMHEMKRSGLVPILAGYCEPRAPLSFKWSELNVTVKSPTDRAKLWSLMHYMNDHAVDPSKVDDLLREAFSQHMAEVSPTENTLTKTRSIIRIWNRLTLDNPHMSLQALTVPPPTHHRLSHGVHDYPQSFQNELEDYCGSLELDDMYADDARDRPVSPKTVKLYRRRILRVASTLVDDGFPRAELTGLDVLVRIDVFNRVRIVLSRLDRSAQRTEVFHTLMLLIRVAKWLGSPDEHVKKLSDNRRKKLRTPKMMMSHQNKKLMAEFDDPKALLSLYKAPEKIMRQIRDRPELHPKTRLSKAQGALSLSILTFLPLRIGNLKNLTFGENVFLRPGGVSSIIIPAEDTKTGYAIEFDIPPVTASLLLEYRDDIAFKALGCLPEKVFCRVDGVGKSVDRVRGMIESSFREHVGFSINPHAFRHLAAKLILDSDPGAHTMVQELLGHQSVATSTAYYSGLSSRRAGRHHHSNIMKSLNQEPAGNLAPGF